MCIKQIHVRALKATLEKKSGFIVYFCLVQLQLDAVVFVGCILNSLMPRVQNCFPGLHATHLQKQIPTRGKPTSSDVLTSYLLQRQLPPWTSYFVKYQDIVSDQRGLSHFNWKVDNANYHILRTGCYPYIKYHCTQRPAENLSIDDYLFRTLKIMNLGIPCLAYGIAAQFLISHKEQVVTPKGQVTIYFLYKEDIGAIY